MLICSPTIKYLSIEKTYKNRAFPATNNIKLLFLMLNLLIRGPQPKVSSNMPVCRISHLSIIIISTINIKCTHRMKEKK